MRVSNNSSDIPMNSYIRFFFLLSLTISACKSDPVSSTTSSAEQASTDKSITAVSTKAVRDTFDCETYGRRDKATAKWFPEQEYYFQMANDIFTQDSKKQSGYNVFQVYNTLTCELMYNGKLPMVEGVELPYRLQTDIYNPITQLVCTQDPEMTHCYNIGSEQHLVPLFAPMSARHRGTLDPTQGRDLESWDNFLFGWTEKIGIYAFDLHNFKNPITITKSATHSVNRETEYVFLVNWKSGKQVLIAGVKDGEIYLHPIFDEPQNLSRRVLQNKSGGQYSIFTNLDSKQFVVVDIKGKKLEALPSNVKTTLEVKKHLNAL